MFIAALVTIAKTWKQRKCSLTNKWIKKIWAQWRSRWWCRWTLNSPPSMNTTKLQLFLEQLPLGENRKLDTKNPHNKGQSWLRWKMKKFPSGEKKDTFASHRVSWLARSNLRYTDFPGGTEDRVWEHYRYQYPSDSVQLR